MDWKKIGIFGALAPIIHQFDNVLQSSITGQHVPITVGTVLLPMLPTLGLTLLALFTRKPNQ